MMSEAKNSRRDFLKLAGTAAPAVAVAAVSGGMAQAGVAVEASGDGYRETDHVRKYLDSARF